MPSSTPSPNGASSASNAVRPRWLALLALGVAVLAVHLWLLSPRDPQPKADLPSVEAADARTQRPAPVTVAAHPPADSPSMSNAPFPPASLPAGSLPRTSPAPSSGSGTAAPPAATTQRPATAPVRTAALATTAQRTPQPAGLHGPDATPDGDRAPERTLPFSDAQGPDPAQDIAVGVRPAHAAQAAETPTPPTVEVDSSAAKLARADTALPASTPPTPPLAWKAPAPVTLHYRIQATRKGLSLPATGTLQWASDGATYNAQMTIEAAWARSRSQTSRGQIDPVLGIQPQRFGDRNRSEQAAHFDRSRQPAVVRFSANSPDVLLTPHTQDRLSVLFQLSGWLSAAPQRWGDGDRLTVHTVGARDAQDWVFEWGAPETLELPLGRMTAWPLRRAPTHVHDNRVELWLAPSLNHLPVRVRWTQANGDVVDQQLERVSTP